MFRLSVFAFSQLQRESHSIVAVLRFEQLHSQSHAQSLLRYTQALGTRLRAFPDLHAGACLANLVCIPSREVVFLGKIRNWLPLEYIALSFLETRLVSRDIRFP